MAYTNAYSAYRETSIKTASQGQLIVMLYDGAVKNLDQAIILIAQKKSQSKSDPGIIEKIGKAVIRAQEIITELTVSLDFDAGEDIAKNLFSLYTFFNQELLEANVRFDGDRIKVVRDMIKSLRDSWQIIAQKESTSGGIAQGIALNIAS
ncbi:MAG: flagellar export chaperone FliS [Spirochaetaceae bacterium]|nr:flagellar export chaperone FliS [Spirochaetaceae bacterium]